MRHADGRIRVALVTNIPAPYRVPVFNILASDPTIDLHVFYSARKEPDRTWDLPEFSHSHSYLRERFFPSRGRFVHCNPDVLGALGSFKPAVVVTTGFTPTQMLAFAFAKTHGSGHVAMTDGTIASEAGLSALHRGARKLVMRNSSAFVAASESGRALLRGYGADGARIFLSPLCANTQVSWDRAIARESRLDFLFSGRLIDIKNPHFALQVARGAADRLGRRTSLAILGTGPLEGALRDAAAAHAAHVELHMPGNVSQADVPAWFADSRVFLFPTSYDPWGVVANEACMAGTPTIVSPHAGVAGELIREGETGYVRALDLAQWIDAAAALVEDRELHSRISAQARRHVRAYSAENAARGIADAARCAAGRNGFWTNESSAGGGATT